MTTVHHPGGLAQDPLYCYHLSTRLGVIILSIQKNACSTQKRWLLQAEDIDHSGDPHRVAYEHLSLLTRPPEIRDRALATLPIIGFLRDPILRLASAYRSKLVGKLNLAGATAIEGAAAARGKVLVRDTTVPFTSMGKDARFAACAGVDYERGLSFREFVEYLAATDDAHLDPHWRSQLWFLGPLLERDSGHNPPPTMLLPLHRVAEVLGQLGQAWGLRPPEPQRPASDSLAPPDADLADMPGGELKERDRLPRVAELYDNRILDLVTERFAVDMQIWSRVSQGPSAAEAIRAARTAAAA